MGVILSHYAVAAVAVAAWIERWPSHTDPEFHSAQSGLTADLLSSCGFADDVDGSDEKRPGLIDLRR